MATADCGDSIYISNQLMAPGCRCDGALRVSRTVGGVSGAVSCPSGFYIRVRTYILYGARRRPPRGARSGRSMSSSSSSPSIVYPSTGPRAFDADLQINIAPGRRAGLSPSRPGRPSTIGSTARPARGHRRRRRRRASDGGKPPGHEDILPRRPLYTTLFMHARVPWPRIITCTMRILYTVLFCTRGDTSRRRALKTLFETFRAIQYVSSRRRHFAVVGTRVPTPGESADTSCSRAPDSSESGFFFLGTGGFMTAVDIAPSHSSSHPS